MHTELSAPAEQKQAFIDDRRGALVSVELAREHGWKLGDSLHFVGPDFPGKWEVTLSGIVESTRAGFGERAVWIHYDYYNNSLLPEQRDQLNMIAVQIDDPNEGARLAQSIDIHFDSRGAHTLTQDDKALNAAIVGRFGAILATMNVVSVLVLGVLVLILGNTVAMSTRERTREFGTLRAIGFSPAHLAAFVLGEAATLGLAGGVLGLALAYPILEGPLSRYLEEEMRITPLNVALQDAFMALALGGALGLVAAGLPALRAARLEVTRSLSHVA
jgi:putative ABC transport system permease protein